MCVARVGQFIAHALWDQMPSDVAHDTCLGGAGFQAGQERRFVGSSGCARHRGAYADIASGADIALGVPVC